MIEKSKIEIARKVCELYSTDKYTIDECLRACGIKTRSTWLTWQRKHPEIAKMYEEAKETKRTIYFDSLVERAENMLEKMISGYEHKVIEREGVRTEDPETGEEIIITKKLKERTIYVPPNITAIFFVLNNREPRHWKRNPAEEKKRVSSKYEDWTDEQIQQEIKRLQGQGQSDTDA